MSVTNGQIANQTTFNNAFMSRTANTTTVGVVGLNNVSDPNSGAAVANSQQAINEIFDAEGMTGTGDTTRKTYSSNEVIANGDSKKVALGKLDAKFNVTSGHDHSGAAGAGKQISALALSNFNVFEAVYQGATKTGASGTSVDVSAQMVGKVSGGTTTNVGVVTAPPENRVFVVDASTLTYIEDATTGQRVYGRMTYATGVWTLSFFTNIAGTETAYNLSSTNIKFIFWEVFNVSTKPTFPSNPMEVGTLDVTADVIDASTAHRGVVNTGTQSFAGNKTFTGTIGASNLSGTNTGDASLGAFGSTPDAKGATISGQVITLQPADDTHPGLISIAAQAFAGVKTWMADQLFQAMIRLVQQVDSTTTGADQSLAPTRSFLKVTNASLASINNIAAPQNGSFLIVKFATGGSVVIKNNTGGTAANRILTGTGANLTVTDGSALTFIYDAAASLWQVVGGSGSGAGGGALVVTGSIASPQSIVAGTGIAYVEGTDARQVWFVKSNGGEVNVIANPMIAPALTVGRELWIYGTHNTDYIILMQLNNPYLKGDWYSYSNSILKLVWNGTAWAETGRV